MDDERPAGGAHVLARVGDVRVGVPAAWVQEVLAPADVALLPRHQGAVVGLLSAPQGLLPLVDLRRWVSMPGAVPPQPPVVLVLHQSGRRVGVQVDRLEGLRQLAEAALQQVCRQPDPTELFDWVARAPEGEPPICVLSPDRLMALTQVWMDDAGDTPGMAAAPLAVAPAAAQRAETALLLRVGQQRLALPCALVAELLPMPPLSQRWQGTGPSQGLAHWRQRPLAVLDLQLGSDQPPAWAVVMCDADGLALMLGMDEVLGLVSPPASAHAPQPDEPWWGGRWLDPVHGECRALRVAALLQALPEASLSRRVAEPASVPNTCGQPVEHHNPEPYMVVEAGGCFAVPVSQVHAVVAEPEAAAAAPAQLLAWRGQSLPIAEVPGLPPARCGQTLMVVGLAGRQQALRVDRLLSLVPTRGGELMALPGRAGEIMLCLQQPAASYRVLDLAGP